MCDCTNQELIKEVKDRGMIVGIKSDIEKARDRMQLVKKFTTGENKDPHVALVAATDVIETIEKLLS